MSAGLSIAAMMRAARTIFSLQNSSQFHLTFGTHFRSHNKALLSRTVLSRTRRLLTRSWRC